MDLHATLSQTIGLQLIIRHSLVSAQEESYVFGALRGVREWRAFAIPRFGTPCGVCITSEYNRSIPGALNNAIDWASRPYRQNVFARLITAEGQVTVDAAREFLRNYMKECHDFVTRVRSVLPGT